MRIRTVATDGVELRLLEAGDDGPVVLPAHGFPELAGAKVTMPSLFVGGSLDSGAERGHGRARRT